MEFFVVELMKKFTSGKALYNELKKAAIFTLCVILFCEWLLYYVVIFQCSWPEIKPGQNSKHETLKVLLLSDTHLLGSQDGHWFDKLRREWQMERAFQTALSRFRPDVVFLLGDLFDEGMKCSDEVNLRAKFPHSPILHYSCRSLLTGKIMAKQCNSCGTMRFFCYFLVAKQRTTHIEPHA